MRKAPFRPDNEISQTFNSGVCNLYSVEDKARPGYRPRPDLTPKAFLRYEEQRLGLNRYYAGRQVNVEAERVIRVPQGPSTQMPTPQDVVRMENGLFYRIDLVQTVPGVWPRCLDLTLVRYMASSVTADAVPPSTATAPLLKEALTPAGGKE